MAIKLSKLRLDKKPKYIFQAVLAAVYIYLFAFGQLEYTPAAVIVSTLTFVVLGSLITHFPNIKLMNFLFSIIMPLAVLSSSILAMHAFPNLGDYVKLFAIIYFAVLYYIVSLVDNVFLVIQDRAETIPLFRVAVTWSLILQIVVAIPLFAGIFRLNVSEFLQLGLICFISLAFNLYQLWALQFDPEAKKPRVGEAMFLSSLVVFLVAVASIMTLFVPTESFLRALMLAGVLMFGLVYVGGHLKNETSEKLLIQYFIFILVLGAILLIFKP